MRRHPASNFSLFLLAVLVFPTGALCQNTNKPYRIESVDLKQRVIWGAELRLPDGTGLAFGGQDQDADDRRPHTRVLKDGKWVAIHGQLNSPNYESIRNRLNRLIGQVQAFRARIRFHYFSDKPEANATTEQIESQAAEIDKETKYVIIGFEAIMREVIKRDHKPLAKLAAHVLDQFRAIPATRATVDAKTIQTLRQRQIKLEIIRDSLSQEPPARAMNCGKPRRKDDNSPASQTIVVDKKTGLYLIFGGDHLDYLTNDTWVFDPKGPRWELRLPKGAPPPRANHHLVANGDGTVTLTGGYTYANNTDYLGGQYVDLDDGKWTYNIERNEWTGVDTTGQLDSPTSRTYRTGPFHPDYYLQGDKPDASIFQAWLKKLPENKWVATNPRYRPRLNRDWGTARIDPSRDIMLRWSGGHSAHGGTDVPHYHFATNRWELPFPVEFPLGQLYSNTSYPNGFNFNMRPWMTGHTYQNYAFDPPSKMMIKAGRPRHFYVYDPDLGDWIGRGEKPKAMQYNSCFYTLTCTATPNGIICWGKNARVHRYSHKDNTWIELELTGDKLPGAYVDNSTIVYDSKRDRVLMFNTPGYGKIFTGEVHALDLKTNKVKTIVPPNRAMGKRFKTIDKSCYDARNDLVLFGTHLKNENQVDEGKGKGHTPTPAFDCATNRWITLDIDYEVGKRGNNIVRHFPHTRSDALMYDAKRQLIWGTDTNSQVYVLRLDANAARIED